MPVFLFECALPEDDNPDATYCFGVIAEDEREAKAIISYLSEAEYIGEQWAPETPAHVVDKKRLN